MAITKVVTHSSPAHMDDFLGLVILKPEVVERITHKEVQYFAEVPEDTLLLDIGMKHTDKVLDHHHDKDMPAAFVLAYDYLYDRDITVFSPLAKLISDIDTNGPKKARKINNVSKETVDTLYALMIPVLRTFDKVLDKGLMKTDLFKKLNHYFEKHDHQISFPLLVRFNQVIQSTYPKEYKEVLDEIDNQKELTNKALKEATEISLFIDGHIHIGIINPIPEAYIDLEANGYSFMISESTRSNTAAIYTDTEVLHVTKVLEQFCIEKDAVDFIHNSGFLAVLKDTLDQFIAKHNLGDTND